MDDGRDIVTALQDAGAAQRRAEAAQRKADLAAYRAQAKPAKAKRAKPAAVSERVIQQGIVAWLRQHGWIVSATQNERGAASDDPGQAARFGASRKRSGVTAGFPDLTALSPAGRVVFLEVKAAAGRLSQAQIELHAWLHAHGHLVFVVRSIEDVVVGFAAAGIPVGARSRLHLAAPVDPL